MFRSQVGTQNFESAWLRNWRGRLAARLWRGTQAQVKHRGVVSIVRGCRAARDVSASCVFAMLPVPRFRITVVLSWRRSVTEERDFPRRKQDLRWSALPLSRDRKPTASSASGRIHGWSTEVILWSRGVRDGEDASNANTARRIVGLASPRTDSEEASIEFVNFHWFHRSSSATIASVMMTNSNTKQYWRVHHVWRVATITLGAVDVVFKFACNLLGRNDNKGNKKKRAAAWDTYELIFRVNRIRTSQVCAIDDPGRS